MSGVAHISAETAYYLVEQYPIDYVFIDGREGKEQESLGHIEGSSNLPAVSWSEAFALSEAEFSEKFKFSKPKKTDHLIFCSPTGEYSDLCAAEKCMTFGYKRIAFVTGGIQAYSLYDPSIKLLDNLHLSPTPITRKETTYPWITTEEFHKAEDDKFFTLDLRREDEIKNFGTYPKALNLPTEECIRATQVKEEDWEREYGFAKPKRDQPVLLYCRSNRRAKYVYKVFVDAGWEEEGIKMVIFKDGVAGLSRLSPNVKAYDSYGESGDPVPPVIPPVDPFY